VAASACKDQVDMFEENSAVVSKSRLAMENGMEE
jgi:hypothetical protein